MNANLTNADYRCQRGTDQPFNPSRAQQAWAKIRAARQAAERARIDKGKGTDAILPEMDRLLAKQEKPKKARPPRRVKERKTIDNLGRVRVCSTEKRKVCNAK